MSSTVFDQMMAPYTIRTIEEKNNALHEVMQQIALAGLFRAGFFSKAAFYGGTCLRIFHSLPRFSEDLDFSLLETNQTFSIEDYFDSIVDEFKALGREVEISKKEKKQASQVESAFLKDTTDVYQIRFQTTPSVKIKLEIDTNPPLGFSTESKLLLLPFSFMVNCFTLPDLFAGKMHAFLFRSWKNRVKGRDWYDFEWYVRNNIPLGFRHFANRAKQTHGFNDDTMTPSTFKELLTRRILETDIELVKNDVLPFLKNPSEIDIWSTDYFIKLIDFVRIEGDY
jgi:predicted nucleotidyltransferase component of viral defense system